VEAPLDLQRLAIAAVRPLLEERSQH